MEAPGNEIYQRPWVRDLGTLQELTAACVMPGSGDHMGHGFSTHSSTSTGWCISSPARR